MSIMSIYLFVKSICWKEKSYSIDVVVSQFLNAFPTLYKWMGLGWLEISVWTDYMEHKLAVLKRKYFNYFDRSEIELSSIVNPWAKLQVTGLFLEEKRWQVENFSVNSPTWLSCTWYIYMVLGTIEFFPNCIFQSVVGFSHSLSFANLL